MARKAYIGVNGKARRVTKMYIGAKMLTNLLPAGDFEGSGWSGATYSTAHAYSGTRSMQCVGTAGSAEDTHNTTANIALNNTHQYYASIYGWQDTKTNGARVGFYWPVAEPSFNDNLPVGEAGQWNRYSATNNRNSFSNGSYPFRVDWNNNGVAGTIYFDGCMLIDLTAEFGAGNEPTKEWCDKHIRFTAGGQVCAFVDGNSKARNIKKAYIGIGGKARPFFTLDVLEYYGIISPLSIARSSLAATTIGNYALFGGGYDNAYNANDKNTVDAYNASLVRSTPTALSEARRDLAATTIGNYALFGGGYNNELTPSRRNTVDAYNASLVRSTPTALSEEKEDLAATAVGNYALFGGGYKSSSNPRNTVDAYNASLVRSTPTALFSDAFDLAATTVGDYALFGGGNYDDNFITTNYGFIVNYYSAYLLKGVFYIPIARYDLAATTVGDYALFGGGFSSNENPNYRDTVEAINASLVRSTPAVLSEARSSLAATTIGNYALFGGGYKSSSNPRNTVDAYNASLVRSTPTVLSEERYNLAATAVGNYALFGGGYKGVAGSLYSGVVDVYVNDT